jgi:hypothetical protein
VEFEQVADGVADDPAGIVGTHDHPYGGHDRLLHDRQQRGGIGRSSGIPQQTHRLVHLPAMRVRGLPPVQVRPGPDQSQHHVTDVLVAKTTAHGRHYRRRGNRASAATREPRHESPPRPGCSAAQVAATGSSQRSPDASVLAAA